MPRSTRPGARAADLPRGAAWPGVLAVDDDAAVLGLLSVGLALQGFSVWQASSGAEAIAIYSAHRADIHVVLLDVDMPGLDGPQTLTALRALDPDLPAGFMTGSGAAYVTGDLVPPGVAFVTAKPFQLKELADALRRVVAHAPAAGPPGPAHGPGDVEGLEPGRESFPH